MNTIENTINAMAAVILAATEDEKTKARENLAAMLRENPARDPMDTECAILDILLDLGAPDSLQGHAYAVEAIKMALEDPNRINAFTSLIYPGVAEKFATNATCVGRDIRHLIEVTWDRGDLDVLKKYFGNTVSAYRGRPTNREFVARIVNCVRMKVR